MSKIALSPNASGTGTFTLSAPNSNTSRTFELPDADGNLLTSQSSLNASKLTGALPAISGAALTNISSTVVVRSTDFTGLTTNSRIYSFDHGESTAPDLVFGELIVNVATSGYAVGDVVKLSSMMEIDENDYVLSFSCNSTRMVMACNDTTVFRVAASVSGSGSSNDFAFSLNNISLRVVGVWF